MFNLEAMLMAMDKIWFLFLSVNLACCNLDEQNAQDICADCMPILECKAAEPFLNPTEESLNYIDKFFCGITDDSFYVCCSKLKSSLNDKPHPNLKLLPDNCGKIYNSQVARIFGGDESNMFEFPWMVLIAHKPNGQFKCSGTLINSRYVLTAAHCAQNVEIAGVRIGEHQIGADVDCKDGVCAGDYQDHHVQKIIIHEDYNPFNYDINDIALFRLAENVDMPLINAGTICLPITEELQSRNIVDLAATVAGWGETQHKQGSSMLLKVDVPVRSNEYCQNYYSHISPSDKEWFCAGKQNKDSCQGDSGGPLMIEDSYKGTIKMVQYGIVSYGGKYCGTDQPGVYINVRNYVKWILDNIKE